MIYNLHQYFPKNIHNIQKKKNNISTALCILLYSDVSTYVGGYMEVVCLILGPTCIYVTCSFPTLFACFLGFDVPTSSFIFIENVFYYSCMYMYIGNCKL